MFSIWQLWQLVSYANSNHYFFADNVKFYFSTNFICFYIISIMLSSNENLFWIDLYDIGTQMTTICSKNKVCLSNMDSPNLKQFSDLILAWSICHIWKFGKSSDRLGIYRCLREYVIQIRFLDLNFEWSNLYVK